MSRRRYCGLTGLNRTSHNYKRKGENEENLRIMRKLDEYYQSHPTAGVVTMSNMLRLQGYAANPKRVRRLLRKMGLRTIHPQRALSKPGQAAHVHPYLLRGLKIERRNQVRSTDISYIPMERGFMYLYAIIDVYSRYIVGWRLSNTLEGSNCVELLEECVRGCCRPEIVNTDQGSQYTSPAWVGALESLGIAVSMDGRGRCKDNIWIERFWRTIRQEYVYRYPETPASRLREGIGDFVKFYNEERPHQSLGEDMIPARMYFGTVAA
ncbi:MAG: IS3 family transposase [Marinilabiliaceae bacterium]